MIRFVTTPVVFIMLSEAEKEKLRLGNIQYDLAQCLGLWL